jgi:hypothetical protein
VHTRQWEYCSFGYVPQLTELLVTVEDESYTCKTGNEKSYRSNDSSADNAIQKELWNWSLMNLMNQE